MRFLWLLALAGVGACGTAEVPPPPPNPPPSPPPPTAPKLTFQTPDTAPRLYFQGQLQDGQLNLELWSEGLGEVFGLGGVVRSTSAPLSVEQAQVLGAEDRAMYLLRSSAQEVLFGSTRKSTAEGSADLNAGLKLLSLSLAAPEGASETVELERIVIRRSDGSYVAAALGAVTLQGGTE